jgi:hypothetical protein
VKLAQLEMLERLDCKALPDQKAQLDSLVKLAQQDSRVLPDCKVQLEPPDPLE